MRITSKISSAVRNRTTYKVGLLQAKAYTILTKRINEALVPHGITAKEWALLGIVFERSLMRPKDVAQELEVEASYVTMMTTNLKKKGWLDDEQNEADTRAKNLCLTAEGTAFVKKMEPKLRDHMRPLVSGVSLQDMLGYLAVLESIAKHGKN